MNTLIELTQSAAAQLDRLSRMISQRRASLFSTAQYLKQHGGDLSPQRVAELERHLADTRASLCDMEVDYRRIAGAPYAC